MTPFGIYCRVCQNNRTVGASESMIKSHFDKYHGFVSREDAILFKQHAEKQKRDLIQSAEMDKYLLASATGYVCECGSAFLELRHLKKHCNAKTMDCDPKNAATETIYKTVCDRLVSDSTIRLQKQQSATSDASIIKSDDANKRMKLVLEVMEKFVRSDEDADVYRDEFYAILSECGSAEQAESEIAKRVDWLDLDINQGEHRLEKLLTSAEDWLLERARSESRRVPPNFRAALLVFDGNDLNEISQNYVYSFRHYESTLLPILRQVLCFVWRHTETKILDFLKKANDSDFATMIDDAYLVPKALCAILLEPIKHFDRHPVVVQYCLSRCFRKKDDQLKMLSCGEVASDAAAVLSLMRAGVCSNWIGLQDIEEARLTLPRVKDSPSTHKICSLIRVLREMQRRKAKSRIKTIAPNGDISVDSFDFPRAKWSNIVPSLCGKFHSLFQKIFVDDKWKSIFDTTVTLRVHQDDDGLFSYETMGLPEVIASEDLVSNENFDDALLDELTSCVELSFHGTGGGSMRYEEIKKVTYKRARGLLRVRVHSLYGK